MRSDRLLAILLTLQARGKLTAAELATRLEVSKRTIQRDLEALGAAGVPLYAERGRGGGWALLDGYHTDLTGLTEEEARALFLVAGPAAIAGPGVEPELRSALRKLLAALPAAQRPVADAASGRVLLDPTGWGRSPEAAPHLDTIRQALLAGRRLRLQYARDGEPPTERPVDPYGLVAKAGVWYLLGAAGGERRTYRLSRVLSAAPTDEPSSRPADFDLAAAWQEARREFEARESCLVLLRAAPTLVPLLRRLLATRARPEPWPEGTAGGWEGLRLHFPALGAATAALAGFGAQLVVVEPPELRAELRRLGRELAAAYGDD